MFRLMDSPALCYVRVVVLSPWIWSVTFAILCASTPTIDKVEHPAIQRGATGTLRIVGSGLATAREVHFYSNGIACQSIRVSSNEQLELELKVSSRCETGAHTFRVRTDDGFTQLRSLCVTPFPVLREADVTKLPVNHSVLGDLSDGQADHFEVDMEQNSRLSIDVEAIRLGIDMLDASVVVRDPDNRIVAQADDSNLYRQDPILSVLPDRSGTYTVEVIDAGRNGGEQAVYILHLSDGPRPTSVFPLGGQPGTTIPLRYCGDAGGCWEINQTLPNSRAPSTSQVFAQQNDKASATSLPFRLSPLSNYFDTGANDDWSSISSLEAIDAPIAINGVLEQFLDRDCFWLRSQAGQSLEVDLFAYRLGSAADTVITVVDSQLRPLAISDDVDSLDSRLDIVVPADGRFGLMVEEKRGKGGIDFSYRVEISPLQSTAELFLPRRDRTTQDLQTIAIPLGNRALALLAVRKDEANGQTSIQFPQLPQGCRAHYMQPRLDQAIVPVVFDASPDAPLTGQLIPAEVNVLTAHQTVVGQFHQVTDLVGGPADAIYAEHHADRLAICTRTVYPVAIQTVQPSASLPQDGTLDVTVKIMRQTGFEGDVILSLPWLPPWIDAEPRFIVPGDQSHAVIRLRAWKDADVADWPLVVEALADLSSRGNRLRGAAGALSAPAVTTEFSVASLPVELSVQAPLATASLQPTAAEQGQTVDLGCQLDALPDLRKVDSLVASLEGLPNRVSSDPVPIDHQSQSFVFKVCLEPTAPIGNYTGIACRLSGTLNQERISFVVARDGQLIIDRPGKVMRDAVGRPLNRVEALRKRNSEGTTNSDAR